MTNRTSIFGALAWVLVAGLLTSAALEPVSAGTGACSASCVPSAASGTLSCATVA